MQQITMIRVLFIVITMAIGYWLGDALIPLGEGGAYLGVLIGLVAAFAVIVLEMVAHRLSPRGITAAVFGLLLGLLLAKIFADVVSLAPFSISTISAVRVVSAIILSYLGMVMALRGRDDFNLIIPYVRFARQDERQDFIVLDTSAIIDGRIADLCQTKFVDGRLLVPRFVLRELQGIADSADHLKRARGRRGLDVLNRLRKSEHIQVKIHEEDFPEVSDVDAKLVKVAKILDARIMTNDYNLNKVAELQGVAVLNINDLCNALRPVVLPGEMLEVKLSREGKEYNQGVAYLDDGTMVVVDNGRPLIGQQVRVAVTSVLQTSAGRMIFAKLDGASGQQSRR